MTLRMRPRLLFLPLAVTAVVAAASPSSAVSDGDYDPAKQGCSTTADDSAHPDYTESGC